MPQEEGRRHGGHGDDLPPRPTVAEVLACQFSSWYPAFRDMDVSSLRGRNVTAKRVRRNVTIESVVIRPLPGEFLEYLTSDGVRLPECARAVSSCINVSGRGGGGGDDGWDSSSEEGGGGGDNIDRSGQGSGKYSFPALTERIRCALAALGGGAGAGCMPKLNWSSPRDAAWMNCGSLRCTEPGDVYLLLKSSDFVAFDLERAWDDLDAGDGCDGSAERDGLADDIGYLSIKDEDGKADAVPNENSVSAPNLIATKENPPGFDFELVLRKWCNLHPSMEFRCFVYDHELVAISQRHPSKFYPHLQPLSDGSMHPSVTIIHAFFETYVRGRFARGKIGRYVVDTYLDSRERVWIVDFNVWGDRTDGLLFDWEELAGLGAVVRRLSNNEDGTSNGDLRKEILPVSEVRVVTRDMKFMTYDPLSSYRGPTDVMDILTGIGGTSSFEQFMKCCVRPSDL